MKKSDSTTAIEDLVALRDHCLALPGVQEDTPFGPDVLVFKVASKMFALCGLQNVPETVNLKCDPDWALDLRDQYVGIRPGYHMSKKHWNTVTLGEGVPPELVGELVDHSYALVVRGLPKKVREAL